VRVRQVLVVVANDGRGSVGVDFEVHCETREEFAAKEAKVGDLEEIREKEVSSEVIGDLQGECQCEGRHMNWHLTGIDIRLLV
jgi:hypothetical protein